MVVPRGVEDADRGLRHLEEGAGQVVSGLGHDHVRIAAEDPQPLDVRVHLPEGLDVDGVEQRPGPACDEYRKAHIVEPSVTATVPCIGNAIPLVRPTTPPRRRLAHARHRVVHQPQRQREVEQHLRVGGPWMPGYSDGSTARRQVPLDAGEVRRSSRCA